MLLCAHVLQDGEAITTFALRPDGEELVMCTQSFRVRQYSLPDGTERRNWAVLL